MQGIVGMRVMPSRAVGEGGCAVAKPVCKQSATGSLRGVRERAQPGRTSGWGALFRAGPSAGCVRASMVPPEVGRLTDAGIDMT